MTMDDAEIAHSYRNAKIRIDQIKVLAELNDVPAEVIRAKLVSLGFPDAAKTRKRCGGRPQVVDPTHLKELYSQGLTDAEIASKMGVKRNTVSCWRQRTGLTGGRSAYET